MGRAALGVYGTASGAAGVYGTAPGVLGVYGVASGAYGAASGAVAGYASVGVYGAASGAKRSSSSAGVGRRSGSLARHARTTGRSPSGTVPRSAGSCTDRYIRPIGVPAPNALPPAAATSTAPSANTSAAPPTSSPCACSGARNPGVPKAVPVAVSRVDSSARAMPKSRTRGPSGAITMLPGFRSRWTRPQPWIAASASASAAPSRRSRASSIGPSASSSAESVGPGTYAVASQGAGAAGSASTTGAVWKPPTLRAAATSARNRSRKCGSPASSGRATFTATARPPRERACADMTLNGPRGGRDPDGRAPDGAPGPAVTPPPPPGGRSPGRG